MRDQQFESLNDDLAREIEQALAVEPSHDFQARVRQRVTQAASARWTDQWRWAAAFAAVVVAASGIWLVTRPPSGPSGLSTAVVSPGPGAHDTVLPATDSAAEPRKDMSSPVAAAPIRQAPVDVRRARLRVDQSRPVEIVISAEDALAFDALRRFVRQDDVVVAIEERQTPIADMTPGTVTMAGLTAGTVTIAGMTPDTVTIAPIDIKPVETARGQGAEE